MANLNIPNFLGGVSKQPFTQREVNEAQEQINCYNSLSDGLIRRPSLFKGTNFNVSETITDIKSFVKIGSPSDVPVGYEYGDYILQSNTNDLHVVKPFSGMETINFESPAVESAFKNYASQSVNEELKYLTINDATFVYNPEVTVEKDTVNLTPEIDTQKNIAYVYVANSAINKQFKIFLDYGSINNPYQTSSVSYTPSTSESTNTIARKLISTLVNAPSSGNGGPGYRIYNGNYYDKPTVLRIRNSDDLDFTSNFDITIEGDIYYEDEDIFRRETKVYSIVSGTNEFVTTEKWGSMKYATIISNSLKTIIARVPTNYGGAFAYSSNLIFAGTSKGGLDLDVSVNDDIVRITKSKRFNVDTKINNINVTDGFSNKNMHEVFGTMKSIELLPPKFYHNEKIKINGNPLTNKDDYYVNFQVNNSETSGEYGSGVWSETIAGEVGQYYNLDTMPFVIKADGFGVRTICYGDWNELGSRIVGDDNTNPYLSFVDNKITTMFMFGSRLCTASENKISMSQSGNLFNFFQTSVVALLPSDPIDVTITSDKNIFISHAMPFQERLLLIADNAQFNMIYNDVLTIDTLKVVETSSYNTSRLVKPLKTNNLMFFVSEYGNNTQVNEFFYDDIALVNGNILTERVEDYIPNGMDLIDANKANDTLVISKKGTDDIYVYQYLVKNKKKILSAWHKWNFNGINIQRLGFLGDELSIFFKDSSGVMRQSYMKLEKNLIDDLMYLDHSFGTTNVSEPISNISTVSLSNAALHSSPEDVIITTASNNYGLPFGYSHEVVDARIVGDDIVVDFREYDPQWDSSKVYFVGFNYNSEYEFTTLMLRDKEGMVINRGRTQLLNQTLTYAKTSGFIYETQVLKGEKKEQKFLAGRLGDPSYVLDSKILETGSERFYLGSKNTDLKQKIKSINELGFRIESSEVEVRFWDRKI